MPEEHKKKWEYRSPKQTWKPFTASEIRYLYCTLNLSMDLVSVVTGIHLVPLSRYIWENRDQLPHDFKNEKNRLAKGMIQAARDRNWAALKDGGGEEGLAGAARQSAEDAFFGDMDMEDVPETSESEAALVRLLAGLNDSD